MCEHNSNSMHTNHCNSWFNFYQIRCCPTKSVLVGCTRWFILLTTTNCFSACVTRMQLNCTVFVIVTSSCHLAKVEHIHTNQCRPKILLSMFVKCVYRHGKPYGTLVICSQRPAIRPYNETNPECDCAWKMKSHPIFMSAFSTISYRLVCPFRPMELHYYRIHTHTLLCPSPQSTTFHVQERCPQYLFSRR